MKTMKLKDKTEITLTDEQALSIEDALMDGKADFIRIDGELYSPKSIDRIVKSNASQSDIFADPWADEDHQIETGRVCKASRSIQREINNIIQSEHPREWAKFISNPKERQRIRKELLAQDPEGWCDNKTGKCVCYAE